MRFQQPNSNDVMDKLESEDDDEVFKDEDLDNQYNHYTSDVLTIEGLRRAYNSCTNCGVSWYDDHISLDCSECGGYAMYRPCPTCNGQCGTMWRRDVAASNRKNKAEWHGSCSLASQWSSQDLSKAMSEEKNANFQTSSYHSASPKQSLEAHLL